MTTTTSAGRAADLVKEARQRLDDIEKVMLEAPELIETLKPARDAGIAELREAEAAEAAEREAALMQRARAACRSVAGEPGGKFARCKPVLCPAPGCARDCLARGICCPHRCPNLRCLG